MLDIFTNEIKSWSRVKGFIWPVLLEASDNIKFQSLAEKSIINAPSSGTTLTAKTFTIRRAGAVRVRLNWYASTLAGFNIYLDGVLIANKNAFDDPDFVETWNNYASDIPVKRNSVVSFLLTVFEAGQTSRLKNLYVSYTSIRYKKNTSLDI
jgi:hypothetical protein